LQFFLTDGYKFAAKKIMSVRTILILHLNFLNYVILALQFEENFFDKSVPGDYRLSAGGTRLRWFADGESWSR